jgi:two-component system, OmpR family, response regulator
LRVLIVEDDDVTAALVRDALTHVGFEARVAPNGKEGLRQAQAEPPDVLVVDRMLPGVDGLSLVRALRTAGFAPPVLFLTALGGLSDKVEGLRAGADDYLVKPFETPELVARVEALGRRRPPTPEPDLVHVGALTLDRRLQMARTPDGRLELTRAEFRILELLALHPGRAVTRAMLVERALDLDPESPGSLVEPHVSRLRVKLERAASGQRILTLRGVGYALVAD